jgi:hypothetical protein
MSAKNCEEQVKLAHAVLAARRNVYEAKRDLATLKESKADRGPYVTALHIARAAERRAVAALDNFKKNNTVAEYCWHERGRSTNYAGLSR